MNESRRITLTPTEFTELLKYRKSHKTINDYADKSGNFQVRTTDEEREFIRGLREKPIAKQIKLKPSFQNF